MSTEASKNVAATGAAKKRGAGLGISQATRGASQLKFIPKPDVYDGLCLGFLKEITLGTADFKENQSGDFADFAGKAVPTINFVFEGIPEVEGGAAPVYIHSYKPMPIIQGKDYGWFYDGMLQTIKHFIDVYTGNKFLAEYEDLLFLGVDLEEGMEFDALKAAYEEFFAGVKLVFDGNGENLPCLYKTADGSGILVWMHMLLYQNGREVNQGNAGFSNYPGEGHIELFRKDVKPSIRINIAKGESIIPREKNAAAPAAPAATSTGAPTSAAGAAGAGAPAGGAKLPNFMTGGKS